MLTAGVKKLNAFSCRMGFIKVDFFLQKIHQNKLWTFACVNIIYSSVNPNAWPHDELH